MTNDARHVLTIVAVEDLDAMARFYEAALAVQAGVRTPVYVELTLLGGQRLGLYQREGFGRNTGQVPARIAPGELAPLELYFHCDDLGAAIARMRQAGARELGALAPRDWGDEAAYFADPAGNVLVLARPLMATHAADS